MELVPNTAADRFIAQPVGMAMVFERDAVGKIVGISVSLPGGREIKASK